MSEASPGGRAAPPPASKPVSPAACWTTALVDLDRPLADLDARAATHAHVTVLAGGVPVGSIVVPAPGAHLPAAHLADAITEHLGGGIAFGRRRNLGRASRTPRRRRSASVLVCTADRPDDLARALASIGLLSTPGLDVVVVDNGRRETARTEAVVRAAGARYVREPVPGLDRARNRGFAEATGEIVLCTDDDVEVHPDWADRLLACFDDPLVMAATGLVLPARLDTPARRQSEQFASHGRGFRRRVLDGSSRLSFRAGSAGAGASMAFRAGFVRARGGFPPELDAGTPARSGGDTWMLFQVMQAGYRIVYEPASIAFHWHREDPLALRSMLHGYGIGTVSFLLRALGDPQRPAPVLGTLAGAGSYGLWLGKRAAASLVGRRGAPPRDVAFEELRGMVQGPAAYRAARADLARLGAGVTFSAEPAPAPWLDELQRVAADVPPLPERAPAISVVIPTRGRREHVLALLHALDAQDYPDDRVEIVVVVDGDVDGTASAIAASELRRRPTVVVLEAPGDRGGDGNGAAAARNAGVDASSNDVLVFLDDDLTPLGPGLLRAHAAGHGSGEAVVVGPCPVDLRDAAAPFVQRLRNWWAEHTTRLVSRDERHFTDVLSGNLSLRRDLFEALGRFPEVPRREDWELGYRAWKRGVTIGIAPAAAALQTVVDCSVAGALADRRREGAGDFGFVERHPDAIGALPLGRRREFPPRVSALMQAVLRHPERAEQICRAGLRVLPALEASGLRGQYQRLLDVLTLVSYWAGVADAARTEAVVDRVLGAAEAARPVVRFEIGSGPGGVDVPGADVDVVHGGRLLGRLRLRAGAAPLGHDELERLALDTFGQLLVVREMQEQYA